jgi:ribonuclease J
MDLPVTVRRDDAVVSETVRITARRALSMLTGRKPVTEVHLVRV